ncbi:hypothetical protein EYF80_050404 [Liparis tanakae]|uniref:Uncharacterized protein n=1 Tax=Liparis tanakae TaxID=230148 RepID=A0A4Z2FEW4_9TELE|nr:hypothetical protein EYF80_050404 [Liparis tanakae]
MGNVVLQIPTEGRLSAAPADAPVVHQEERLVVVVQAAGVTRGVLDGVPSGKTALQRHNRRVKGDVFFCGVDVQPTRHCFCPSFYTSNTPQGAKPTAITFFLETAGAAAPWSLTASPTQRATPSFRPPVRIQAPGGRLTLQVSADPRGHCGFSPVLCAALTSPFLRTSLTHVLIFSWPSPPTNDTTKLGNGRPHSPKASVGYSEECCPLSHWVTMAAPKKSPVATEPIYKHQSPAPVTLANVIKNGSTRLQVRCPEGT